MYLSLNAYVYWKAQFTDYCSKPDALDVLKYLTMVFGQMMSCEVVFIRK